MPGQGLAVTEGGGRIAAAQAGASSFVEGVNGEALDGHRRCRDQRLLAAFNGGFLLSSGSGG